MMNRFNPHICESFYSDEVILVEGDAEAIVYRKLISKYFYDDRDVFILNTGSKLNLVFYQKILTHFAFKHTVVHDIDQKTYISPKTVERKKSNVWTANESIWNPINDSNQQYPGTARRFVHNKDFEVAHGYKVNTAKGKPLSADEFAKYLEIHSDLPAIEFLKDLFSEQSINYSQEYILEVAQSDESDDVLATADSIS